MPPLPFNINNKRTDPLTQIQTIYRRFNVVNNTVNNILSGSIPIPGATLPVFSPNNIPFANGGGALVDSTDATVTNVITTGLNAGNTERYLAIGNNNVGASNIANANTTTFQISSLDSNYTFYTSNEGATLLGDTNQFKCFIGGIQGGTGANTFAPYNYTGRAGSKVSAYMLKAFTNSNPNINNTRDNAYMGALVNAAEDGLDLVFGNSGTVGAGLWMTMDSTTKAIRLDDYTGTTKSAATLGKTDSNLLAKFATDGTVITKPADYVANFVAGDWVTGGSGDTLTITAATHGLGSGRPFQVVVTNTAGQVFPVDVIQTFVGSGNVEITRFAGGFNGIIRIL